MVDLLTPDVYVKEMPSGAHQIESVGRAMRRMMPFLDAKEVLPGQTAVSAPEKTLRTSSPALAGAGR